MALDLYRYCRSPLHFVLRPGSLVILVLLDVSGFRLVLACDSDQTLVTKSTSTMTTRAASTHHITAVALVPSHASSCC
jgi:hypothetical protein